MLTYCMYTLAAESVSLLSCISQRPEPGQWENKTLFILRGVFTRAR